MRKLRIDIPLTDIKGQQLHDRCGKDDCLKCSPKEGKVLDCAKGKGLTVGDLFLQLLSQNGIIDTKDKDAHKHAFWVIELGMQISDAKSEIEISEDKHSFLRKLIERNKFKNQQGLEDDFFLPYTWGQMLLVFDEEKMAEKEKLHKKGK